MLELSDDRMILSQRLLTTGRTRQALSEESEIQYNRLCGGLRGYWPLRRDEIERLYRVVDGWLLESTAA